MTRAVLLVLLALGLAAPGPVGAQAPRDEAELDALTRKVASQLRCPVCQGESIQDSPSELAQDMKAVVREQLAAGRTPEEVKAYFVSKYGEWILLEPEAHGFNLALYLLPVVAFVGGAATIAVAVRRWTRRGSLAESPVPGAPSDTDPGT